MSCDIGKTTEGLENELWRRWSDGKAGEWAELIVIVIAELILQTFRHFTYVTTHSPTLPSLYLRQSSFSNPSVAPPTSQFILQPFFRFSYDTSSSLIHLASRPWFLPPHVPLWVSRHSIFIMMEHIQCVIKSALSVSYRNRLQRITTANAQRKLLRECNQNDIHAFNIFRPKDNESFVVWISWLKGR